MSAVDAFIRDLRQDSRFTGAHAALVRDLAAALEALEFEGDENIDAGNCSRAIECLLSQSLSTDRKLQVVHRLLALDKVENLNIRELIGH